MIWSRTRNSRDDLAYRILFWLAAACVLYIYVGYPLLLALAAWLRPAPRIRVLPAFELPVSVVLAAHNEECRIRARVRELVELVAGSTRGGRGDRDLGWLDGPHGRRGPGRGVARRRRTGGRVPVRVLVQELQRRARPWR